MADADVVVVGGGPAGAAAATTLARRGLDVTLVDKATFPRDKFCGDGLTVWALRELTALGLDPSDVASWKSVGRVEISSPSRHVIELDLPTGEPFAAVARRHDLDAAVLDLARDAGAEVLEGHGLVSASTDPSGVTVETTAGATIRARFVIGADGMWSPLRKQLGCTTPGYRGEWHAFRQYFTDVGPAARENLLVWFEPDFLPGYAWSFPVGDGDANVGFGILRGGRWSVGAMRELWRELLERPQLRDALGPDARAEGAPRAWPIPARVDEVTLTAERALFVGDAAAAADALTGEGIGQALATGRWAAEAIADALERPGPDDPAQVRKVREVYEARVRRELFADHAMSTLLGRALSHRRGARTAIRLAGLTPWTRRNFARWLFEDYPRAIVFTPGRWSELRATR